MQKWRKMIVIRLTLKIGVSTSCPLIINTNHKDIKFSQTILRIKNKNIMYCSTTNKFIIFLSIRA